MRQADVKCFDVRVRSAVDGELMSLSPVLSNYTQRLDRRLMSLSYRGK